MRIVLIMVASLFISKLTAQTHRYMVFFSDKAADDYPYNLSTPSMFLSERALERREKQNITIEETDLPVHPGYLQEVAEAGADVFFSTKWLNGALVQMDENLVSHVEELNFVDSVALVAEGTRLSYEKEIPETPTSFTAPPTVSGNTDFQLLMLNADRMHDDNYKGQGMLVAVFDNGFTGVNATAPFEHLWENEQIYATRDFVENSGNVFQFGSHGTSVFSIIGAKYEDEEDPFTGVAHQSDFILCVTEDNQAENRIEEFNWLFAAEYADSLGVDVINTSLGYNDFDISEHNYGYGDLDGETAIISIAANIAARKGIIVTASAGNEGNKSWQYITPPADSDSILTVGSVTTDFERSSFSSFGPTADDRMKPDVAAFGDATCIVTGNGSIIRGSGTSYSAPLIAGFAASIWQANPEWSSQQVIQAIKESGTQSSQPDTLIGYGVPNYTFAVVGEKTLQVEDILDDKITIFPNPFHGNTLYLKTESKLKKGLNIRILDAKGTEVLRRKVSARETKEQIELKINSSEPGVYFLFLRSGKDEKVAKLINF